MDVVFYSGYMQKIICDALLLTNTPHERRKARKPFPRKILRFHLIRLCVVRSRSRLYIVPSSPTTAIRSTTASEGCQPLYRHIQSRIPLHPPGGKFTTEASAHWSLVPDKDSYGAYRRFRSFRPVGRNTRWFTSMLPSYMKLAF